MVNLLTCKFPFSCRQVAVPTFLRFMPTGFSIGLTKPVTRHGRTPFNGVRSYVSYQNTRFIVFWSKNPRPLLEYLPILERRGIGPTLNWQVQNLRFAGRKHSLGSRNSVFTRSSIDFILNFADECTGYGRKIGAFWDILPDKFVGIFNSTLLPRRK